MAAQPDSVSTGEAISRFSLNDEIAQARARQPWPSGVFAKTLVKQCDLRVVLILMDGGAKMQEHHADGSISVQVLSGTLRMRISGRTQELREGELVTLPPSLRHDVEAVGPSQFLLTISWPDKEKLESIPHRGYGS